MLNLKASKYLPLERKKALIAFQKGAKIKFKNLEYLDVAFYHRSTIRESKSSDKNNERLEFLGDSVLGLVIASELYSKFKNRQEGSLAKIKAAVVSEDSLAQVAVELHVDKYLVLGRGEEISGGREKKAILADALEAVIGALFLDSGYESARKFIISVMGKHLRLVSEHKEFEDYKSVLQEYVQKRFKKHPRYTVDHVDGPEHNKIFFVKLEINGQVFGPGKGKSKKEAEQEVAALACKALGLHSS